MRKSDLQPLVAKGDWLSLYTAAYSPDWAEGLLALPQYMWRGVVMWSVFGVKPGGFLQAIIAGDLYKACDRADGTNIQRLDDYAFFFYNYVPSEAKGPQALDSWTGMAFEPEDEVSA
jgi:hypothetical protein